VKARKRAALNPECIDTNQAKLPDPTMKWVNKPKMNAKSLLLEQRRTDSLKDQ